MTDLRVKEVAESKGISAYELANRLKISTETMYSIWNGTGNPTVKTLKKIAKELGVSLADLVSSKKE